MILFAHDEVGSDGDAVEDGAIHLAGDDVHSLGGDIDLGEVQRLDAFAAKEREENGLLVDLAVEPVEMPSQHQVNGNRLYELVKERLEWQAKAAEEEADELQAHKDKVALLKQELAFLKASGASDAEIVAQQKEIQKALHAQADYMRSIKAEEKDIKALSTEWWEIQNDILETTEKLAQKLRDEIAETLGDIADSLESSADAMTKPLQDELDQLNAQKDATEDRLALEEKILAVEKARIALENAQKERTVRQYNAQTGAWEWVANAKNVETAQKNLIDAENNLQKYREEQDYKTKKVNLEKQIKSTNSAFDSLKDAINEAAKAIKDGSMSYQEAYAYIKNK